MTTTDIRKLLGARYNAAAIKDDRPEVAAAIREVMDAIDAGDGETTNDEAIRNLRSACYEFTAGRNMLAAETNVRTALTLLLEEAK